MFRQPPVRRRFPVPVEALMPVEMQENGLGSAPPRSNRKIASLRSPRPAGAKKQPCDVNQVVGSRVFTGGGSIEHGPKPFLRPPARFAEPFQKENQLLAAPASGGFVGVWDPGFPAGATPTTPVCPDLLFPRGLDGPKGRYRFRPGSCSFRP